MATRKETLDQKHKENIKKMLEKEEKLDFLKDKLQVYKDKLEKLDKNPRKKDYIIAKSSCLKIIHETELEIKYITDKNYLMDYATDALPILIEYYADNKTSDAIVSTPDLSQGKNCFGKAEPEDDGNQGIMKYLSNNSQSSSNSNSKAALYDKYLEATDYNYHKNLKRNIYQCKNPGCGGEIISGHFDGGNVCSKCGLYEEAYIMTEKPNYKEPSSDNTYYAYKRINHLTEILSQLQAKGLADVPNEVYDAIIKRINTLGINKDNLTIFSLRKILKKLKLIKYYDHIPHILQIINGKEPPNFTREQENKIKKMFRDIQKPFSIVCPKTRKNFLNYSYTMHKICELLELDEFLYYFPLLKNNDKLSRHDSIWKDMCKILRWKYYKSI